MKIVDTHCHYNLEPLYSGKPSHFSIEPESPLRTLSWQDHWKKAQDRGVIGSVVVGTTLETSLQAVEISAKDPHLVASLGIHPHFAPEVTVKETEALFTQILNSSSEKIVALGETGLDYFKLSSESPDFATISQKQHEMFRLHIDLAKRYSLPLIIHVRDNENQAYQETLQILKESITPGMKFVLHCASGPTAYIQEAILLGGYIGFDGNSTYKNAGAIRELILQTPPDRLLLETDAPYLPPQNHRGKVCEPWMIAETAEHAQSVLHISLEKIQENTQEFFQYDFENGKKQSRSK